MQILNHNNLPLPDNIPVSEAASQMIFNKDFDQNGLYHRRMEQCRKSRVYLLLSIAGDANVIPMFL